MFHGNKKALEICPQRFRFNQTFKCLFSGLLQLFFGYTAKLSPQPQVREALGFTN